MKEYVKPEAEIVMFASEVITDAIMGNGSGNTNDI